MKLINKKDNQITFEAEISESLANAIRRFVSQIPVLAVDEVEISKNDSPLYDETVAHRIGLIPLKAPAAKKAVKLKLDTDQGGIVYSKELKGPAKPVYDEIPIASLNKGQKLSLVATTKQGKGEEHSKFAPGLIFYRNIFDVKVDKDCPKEVVDACPQKIFKLENNRVVAKNPEKCDMCGVCLDICKKLGKDSIKITPTKKLLIAVESFGQLDSKDILKKSIEALKKDLAEVAKKAGK
jgi:DNA-directed RNA polymerase subunit D